MTDYHSFARLATTSFADVLSIDQVMPHTIVPLWQPMPRIAGPAYPVSCAPGDNLMVHAAIYRAEPGSIIVVAAGDERFAVSGGNVCATAQQRGIAGFIVDGVVRDLEEVRQSRFPVYARGLSPKPGAKRGGGSLDKVIVCGGVKVFPGDVVVADEEGIVLIPGAERERILEAASKKARLDESLNLEQWSRSHRARIEQIMAERGPDT